MTASPIMTLFRDWEAKYAKAADMIATTDAESDDLLAQCREIELRMMQLPAGDTADFAAKMIVSTAYGGFAIDEEGPLIAEAKALVAGGVVDRPDVKLIELGYQFEAAKAKARPLEKEKARLYAESERLADSAGLTDRVEDRQAHGVIRQRVGYHAASKAFLKAHSEAVRLMKAIHRTKATTLEGFAVKAAAVAFDQADFDVAVPVPSDVAERELYRLARDMAKVVKARGQRNG